ncbi:MAG: hypothetical protein SGARI_004596 [Bacillariaceae sp.]
MQAWVLSCERRGDGGFRSTPAANSNGSYLCLRTKVDHPVYNVVAPLIQRQLVHWYAACQEDLRKTREKRGDLSVLEHHFVADKAKRKSTSDSGRDTDRDKKQKAEATPLTVLKPLLGKVTGLPQGKSVSQFFVQQVKLVTANQGKMPTLPASTRQGEVERQMCLSCIGPVSQAATCPKGAACRDKRQKKREHVDFSKKEWSDKPEEYWATWVTVLSDPAVKKHFTVSSDFKKATPSTKW